MHVIPVVLMPKIPADSNPEIFADGPDVAMGLKPSVGGPDKSICHAELFYGRSSWSAPSHPPGPSFH